MKVRGLFYWPRGRMVNNAEGTFRRDGASLSAGDNFLFCEVAYASKQIMARSVRIDIGGVCAVRTSADRHLNLSPNDNPNANQRSNTSARD
jgi:hypothetical protein